MNKQQKIVTATVIVSLLMDLYLVFLFVQNLSLSVHYNLAYSIRVLVSLFGIVAAILALASRLRNTLMLRLYFIYILAVFPFDIMGAVFTYAAWTTKLEFSFWFFHTVDVFVFAGAFYSLRYFISLRSVKLVATDVATSIEMLPTLTGLWRRFANRMLDVLIVVILSARLYSHVSSVLGYYESIGRSEHEQIFSLETLYILRSSVNALELGLGPYAINFLVFPAYYIFFEYFFQTTFGKTATGCRVSDTYQQKPGLGRIILRTLCRYIPLDAFSFFFSEHHRGFHDKFSRTYVIDDAEEIHIRDNQSVNDPKA